MASVLPLIADLAPSEHRPAAARVLAEHLGARDLLIFAPDEDVGALLPALGFPQTLPAGLDWRTFVRRCEREGQAEAELPYPDVATVRAARGIALRGGGVLVLLGGRPRAERVGLAVESLPLLMAAFRAERNAVAGTGHAAAALASARQAEKLVASLTHLQGELQVALRGLHEASRLKDEFLATLSHELRTPLNAIVGWAHVLQAGELDPETTARAIETIRRNAQAQNQLISDMLDVSRIVAGKLRLEARPTDLGHVIHEALETVRPTAQAKGVELAQDLDPAPGPVLGDADRLQQVVWNLLSNSIKFTPPGGRVRVTLKAAGSDLQITVEDDGPGVEADFLPHVFDRFRQADSTPSRRHGGLGLGLAIVRHLVELHGGAVAARNRETGTGAIFEVRLPRHRTPADELHTPSDRTTGAPSWLDEAPDLQGVQVLVVDDDPDARELMATVLMRCGAEVSAAASAREGLATLQRERPAVLLADIEMPEEDGYSLIRKVRSLPAEQGGATPAAALTAYASAQDRARALAAGFDIHVPKPIQPAELVAVVASLTSKPRPPRAAGIDAQAGRVTARATTSRKPPP